MGFAFRQANHDPVIPQPPSAPDTDLYYYGHRFYHSGIGRWMSRDPIGEMGGHNLYVYVVNTSLNLVDYLGLTEDCCSNCDPNTDRPRIGAIEVQVVPLGRDPQTFKDLPRMQLAFSSLSVIASVGSIAEAGAGGAVVGGPKGMILVGTSQTAADQAGAPGAGAITPDPNELLDVAIKTWVKAITHYSPVNLYTRVEYEDCRVSVCDGKLVWRWDKDSSGWSKCGIGSMAENDPKDDQFGDYASIQEAGKNSKACVMQHIKAIYTSKGFN